MIPHTHSNRTKESRNKIWQFKKGQESNLGFPQEKLHIGLLNRFENSSPAATWKLSAGWMAAADTVHLSMAWLPGAEPLQLGLGWWRAVLRWSGTSIQTNWIPLSDLKCHWEMKGKLHWKGQQYLLSWLGRRERKKMRHGCHEVRKSDAASLTPISWFLIWLGKCPETEAH